MTAELNHTIVRARDKHASASFLAAILGVEVSPDAGHFVPIQLDNGVTLDYDNAQDIQSQHYAFVVSDETFDAAFARIQQSGIPFYAEPGHRGPGELNHRRGGRGVYFDDPDGHNMELMTRVQQPEQAAAAAGGSA